MTIGKLTLDWKSILASLLAFLGWLASAGPTIIATLPARYQVVAGNIITAAGMILLFFSHAPKIAPPPTPSPLLNFTPPKE